MPTVVPHPEELADDDFRRAILRGIEEAILAATGNRFERMAFLDAGGAVLYACDGDVGGVNVSYEQVARLGGTYQQCHTLCCGGAMMPAKQARAHTAANADADALAS